MGVAGARKADRVADALLRRIVSGELEVGTILPKEAELAAAYGVNRSVVREAIKLLEVHRLVSPVRRRGTEVLDPLASMSPEVIEAMLMPSPGEVDQDVLADFLEIRMALDIEMGALVAARRSDADLVVFDAHLERLRGVLGDGPAYSEITDSLVRAMAKATHNRMYEMLVWWNQEVASKLSGLFLPTRPANEPHLMGLTLLIDLFRRGDVEQVRQLITAFHAWANPRILAAAALSSGAPLSRVLENLK